MAVADAAQALASEHERVLPELDNITLSSSVLLKRIRKSKLNAVSDRPTRVPTMPSVGGKPKVSSMNGVDLGLGSGPTQIPGQITPVCYIHAFSYTKQTEYATDSNEKAIENFATLTRTLAPGKFSDFLDVQLQQAGDNVIDTIVSVTTSGGNITGLVVNNANFFLEDQDVDIWTAVGGTFVGTITCQDSDVTANTIWLTQPVPTGTYTAGQKLMVSGASGQSNTGMFGLRYYNVSTNTGNWLTVQRSSWNGKYTAQNIPVNGALTPQIVRALEYAIELKVGNDADEAELVAHATQNELLAWENNALLVQHIDMAQLKGSESEDMLKSKGPGTIAGREWLKNPRALPGYIDFIALKNAETVETKPIGLYDVGGQTVFGVIGASGGQSSSLVFYMVAEFNVVWRKTVCNGFLNGITLNKGLFGQ